MNPDFDEPKVSLPADRRVTLREFSDAVDCHFTTASRIRAGQRMPSRVLFDRIVKTYNLDPAEALLRFCGPRLEFGRYMRQTIFKVTEEELAQDRRCSTCSSHD